MSSKENCNEDEELSDLLDCALQDFDKPVAVRREVTNEKKEEEDKSKCEQKAVDDSSELSTSELLDFSKFEEALCSLLSEDKDLKDELNSLSESAQQAVADEDVATSLTNTLKGLAENAENIFDSSKGDMTQLLENIAKNNHGDDILPDILPLMQDVMQKLLSKELLYPALKDIVNKYPKWLEEKHGALQDKQYECYSKQYELMKQVCNEFETDDDDNSSASQKERFERVLVLMQKMQDCGHPPKELIGEMAPEIEFDGDGNPKIPGLQGDQCCLM